ncbi:MAG: hypothetical protein ABJJ53_03160 [Sulfitobacter sp.]
MSSKSQKKWLGTGMVLALVVGAIFLIWKFLGLFSGASDSIKATSITAIVSVLVFTIGRYLEQRREAKQRINAAKVDVYRTFFDFYFDIMSYEKVHGKPLPPEKVTKDMLDFQKNVIFWGTDPVIRAYLDFKDAMIRFDAGSDPEALAENLAVMMTAVSNVLVAMRRDLGYTFTSIGPRDIARLQLSDDEETKKIYQYF